MGHLKAQRLNITSEVQLFGGPWLAIETRCHFCPQQARWSESD